MLVFSRLWVRVVLRLRLVGEGAGSGDGTGMEVCTGAGQCASVMMTEIEEGFRLAILYWIFLRLGIMGVMSEMSSAESNNTIILAFSRCMNVRGCRQLWRVRTKRQER